MFALVSKRSKCCAKNLSWSASSCGVGGDKSSSFLTSNSSATWIAPFPRVVLDFFANLMLLPSGVKIEGFGGGEV
jgi:hypothetical protein